MADPETLLSIRNRLKELEFVPLGRRMRTQHEVADAATSGMLSGSRETNTNVPEAKGYLIERMKDKRTSASKLLTLLLAVATAMPASASSVGSEDSDRVGRGKRIAFDSSKGNCLACHHMANGESPGDLGPPLIAIEARFPDKNMLRRYLWDPMANNPGSRMPPFGRHRILSEDEIDMVVEYIYTL